MPRPPVAILGAEALASLGSIREHLQNAQDQATAAIRPSKKAKGLIGRLDPFRQRRYRKARKRWEAVYGTAVHEPDLYDSPLQEATQLLRELAISLEGAKDRKRLHVVERVITLLHDPNVHEARALDTIKAKVHADAAMREWLGQRRSSAAELSQLQRRTTGEEESQSPAAAAAVPEDFIPSTALISRIGPQIIGANEAAIVRMLEKGLNGWFSPGFDSNELDRLTGGNCLVAIGMALHERHGWASSLEVPVETMAAFLRQLQASYRPVAYHNRCHACDVTHGVHWLLTQQSGLRGVAETDEMLFACVVAALIHDVGHDGRGNAYHIATWDEKAGDTPPSATIGSSPSIASLQTSKSTLGKPAAASELALLYSDQSPLERHHCALGFRIMRDTGLLSSLPIAMRTAVRERIIAMVLATDFALHGKLMNEFKLMISSASSTISGGGGANDRATEMEGSVTMRSPPASSRIVRRRRDSATGEDAIVFSAYQTTMTETEQLTLASMVIKVADLSYPTKGFDYSLVWIERCLEEFCEQGDREKERNLPIGYDRSTIGAWKAKSQVGFFTFMVKPMYEALDLLAPLTEQLEALDKLIDHWKAKATEKPKESAPDKV